MNAPAHFTDASTAPVFDDAARQRFVAHYPETPHILRHALTAHPLLEIEALAQLAERLPIASVEYNRGDLPIGVDGKPGSNGLTIAETIRRVAEAESWAVLKNIEQVPAYRDLLISLLDEISPEIEAATGAMLTPQGFIFVSSPNSVTPYHFDPEHNILLQIRGSKVMTQFPAGDTRFVPDEAHETYHAGGPRELKWDDSFLDHGREFPLNPGDALFVPVMAPHFVKNGPAPSVSLSITWRSEWSYRESDARILNAILRARGFAPQAPGRWPQQNYARAYAFRIMRKLGLTGT
ncbi:MAG: cupin-like domain-containing protein [Erythrobacter sp.]|nr:cupin-like domain-containing protein [Erythrobacter sp.]